MARLKRGKTKEQIIGQLEGMKYAICAVGDEHINVKGALKIMDETIEFLEAIAPPMQGRSK